MSGDNLTGNFTSQIFDATGDATWNNLTWTGSKPNIMFKYAVDGAGDIFSSIDLTTWTQQVDNYGRTSDTQEMFSYGDYLYIISSSNREVWRSSTGSSWSVINDTFADSGLLVAEAHSNGDLFIGDASGDVYLSTDYGQTWTTKGDFNGGSTSNAKGMGISSTGEIFIIDGGKALFSSTDSADTWSEITNDYTGSGASLDDLEIDSSGNLYILDAKDVWKSSNSGVSWTIINDSFTPYSNEGLKMFIDSDDNFRITDAAGRVFSSTDSGVTWIEYGDFNGGASSNSKGFALFAQQTNISYQFMNCSTSDCSDGTWQTGDLENINLQSRYFRYVASFSTPDSSSGPIIQTVTTNYDLSNSAPTID